MRPQLPVQPNPNPNNKVVQCIDIQNQPILSLFPAQSNAMIFIYDMGK
jgi:hypothetical protein